MKNINRLVVVAGFISYGCKHQIAIACVNFFS